MFKISLLWNLKSTTRNNVNSKLYLIAEALANHNGSIDRAKKQYWDVKKEKGADAVKFQTYTADTMTLDLNTEDFKTDNGVSDWTKFNDLYKKAETPFDWMVKWFEKQQVNNSINLGCYSSCSWNTGYPL